MKALEQVWALGSLPAEALDFACLTGRDPVFPSSFALGAAAQASAAAAGLAACEAAAARGSARQTCSVDMVHAAVESTAWFTLNGNQPEMWDPLGGLYPCRDGFVRIHTNFQHHREGALQLLKLSAGTVDRADIEQRLASWDAVKFEEAAAESGLAVAALRSFVDWDRSEQGLAVSRKPLLTIEKIGEAEQLALPALTATDRPLCGARVLDLTRILAGPVGGRTLAALGAEVMLINSPRLPNIAAIADTSRGKRSAHIDLRTAEGQDDLWRLAADAHVFIQSYRPGALKSLGFSPEALASRRPGIVAASLSAYGSTGPWSGRRGFDSLVQTAMGFNDAEGLAHGGLGPRALPMQILDMASGFLLAFGVSAALARQRTEGGSWHVELSLAQTGHWLRSLGRVNDGFAVEPTGVEAYVEVSPSGFGQLAAIRPCIQLSRTPLGFSRLSSPPGSSPPAWD